MCLYLNSLNKEDNKVKTATEDIVCWKVLEKTGDNVYRSPYEHYPYKLNTTIKDDGNRVQNIEKKIYGGCFHTYMNMEDAFQSMTMSNNEVDHIRKRWPGKGYPRFNCYYSVVVKCIIPKGTKYYEGTFKNEQNDLARSYASKRLKVTNEVMTTSEFETHNNKDEEVCA